MAKGEKKMGRPKLELTHEQVDLACKLVGIGCTLDHIADILGISRNTLDKRISESPELSGALAKARGIAGEKVLQTAYNMACDGKNPFMTTFWMKCRLGWAEPKAEAPEDRNITLSYSRKKAAE